MTDAWDEEDSGNGKIPYRTGFTNVPSLNTMNTRIQNAEQPYDDWSTSYSTTTTSNPTPKVLQSLTVSSPVLQTQSQANLKILRRDQYTQGNHPNRHDYEQNQVSNVDMEKREREYERLRAQIFNETSSDSQATSYRNHSQRNSSPPHQASNQQRFDARRDPRANNSASGAGYSRAENERPRRTDDGNRSRLSNSLSADRIHSLAYQNNQNRGANPSQTMADPTSIAPVVNPSPPIPAAASVSSTSHSSPRHRIIDDLLVGKSRSQKPATQMADPDFDRSKQNFRISSQPQVPINSFPQSLRYSSDYSSSQTEEQQPSSFVFKTEDFPSL